tara:strand:+ start:291 stop:614 length:324 start_codon:yes stop_codon:yes gene_type:complete
MSYRPLPKEVTINKSNVDGLGLFAVEDITKDTVLGVSHVTNSNFENGYIRTPLGGFVNHSKEPNSVFFSEQNKFPPVAENGVCVYLKSLRNISKGEELLVQYSLYTV